MIDFYLSLHTALPSSDIWFIHFHRYQGVSTGPPKQSRAARNGAKAPAKSNVEAPKPRPAISGPTLTSTTRAEPTVTITPNPLGTNMYSAEPVKQDQPASQARVALKPTPPKPAKPESPAVEIPPKLQPVPLRNREWPPKGDKKNSLNRASSPPVVTEPVKPFKPSKPPRPESHAGILDKAPLPPPPVKKVPRHDQKKDANPENKVALKPVPKPIDKRFPKRPSEERPTSLQLKPSDIKKGLNAGNQRPPRPESHAGVLDNAPLLPPPAKKVPPHDQKPETKVPDNQPKVALKPVSKPIDKRRPTEERPTSLPLKPSDIKKGLNAAGNERPLSVASAAGAKKAPLKPPGPIPPRPASKPT